MVISKLMRALCTFLSTILYHQFHPNEPNYKRVKHLRKFIAMIFTETKIPVETGLFALILCQQISPLLQNRISQLQETEGIECRIFVTSVIIAHKQLTDECFSNKVWADLCGIPIKELNGMEAEFLRLLDYKVWLDQKLLEGFWDSVSAIPLEFYVGKDAQKDLLGLTENLKAKSRSCTIIPE
jgi:hypothetical protein